MEWIKVKDLLPSEGIKVLCWDPKRNHTAGYWISRKDLEDGRMWVINNTSGGIGTKYEVFPPTHWMPLPEPPKS